MQQVYIQSARLKDAPQVRISSSDITPWMSLESCIEWCNNHCFSFVIKQYTGKSKCISDKTLYDSDKPK